MVSFFRKPEARRILPFLCALLLAGCASEAVIRIDQAREADFSRYRSYAFFVPFNSPPYASLESQHLKEAVQRQMQQRDYVYDEQAPDLQVNFDFVLEERNEWVPVPYGPMFAPYFYYGGRRGFGGFGGFYYGPGMAYGTAIDHYVRGSLSIDLIDRREQKSMWRGVWIKRIGEEARKDSAALTDAAVGAVFERYPYRAGSNLPVAMPEAERK
ncbi:MAG: DUF4136 domain-containing protein [Betaproteobacteria bacterium]|nr:DUF4136 domain-containing protein [Betaproteobacteria bacterium]